jgi:cyclopropane fatty-acyl-phospholipid synthase-like methyltransferase
MVLIVLSDLVVDLGLDRHLHILCGTNDAQNYYDRTEGASIGGLKHLQRTNWRGFLLTVYEGVCVRC